MRAGDLYIGPYLELEVRAAKFDIDFAPICLEDALVKAPRLEDDSYRFIPALRPGCYMDSAMHGLEEISRVDIELSITQFRSNGLITHVRDTLRKSRFSSIVKWGVVRVVAGDTGILEGSK